MADAAPDRVTVIIPARNEAASVGAAITEVLRQRDSGVQLEVVVVDDGSTDSTAEVARSAGARVVTIDRRGDGDPTGGNPAVARNRGAAAADGDLLVFLDADCVPAEGWLRALLAGHSAGAVAVGGSLALPPGLPAMARCDYYCGWYHVHSRRRAGRVPNHPPANLSVTRAAFSATSGFTEQFPAAYAHEELAWQAELRDAGKGIYFEPAAVAFHRNRPGFRNLLRRNYRWGYSAVETKASTGAARMAWVYRHPRLLAAASLPLAPAHALYILACWVRAGIYEPVVMAPGVLAARLAYSLGMMVGALRWLPRRNGRSVPGRPRWE